MSEAELRARVAALEAALRKAEAKADLLDRFASETRLDIGTEVGLLALGASARRLIARWEEVDAALVAAPGGGEA